jgi:alanine racemase
MFIAMTRPLICEVSLAAMQHNLTRVRHFNEQSMRQPNFVWSVIKADAYGHGLLAALKGFSQTDGFALIEFEYAVKLREAGWTKPILMMQGAFSPDDVITARKHDLSLTIHNEMQLDWLQSPEPLQPVDIWLKFNTGMNRLGFDSEQAEALAFRFSKKSKLARFGIRQIGLSTHFANSDVLPNQSMPGQLVSLNSQLAKVSSIIKRFKKMDVEFGLSLNNSAAISAYSNYPGYDILQLGSQGTPTWTRPGMMLYGATPFGDIKTHGAKSLGLKPAMSLKTKIIALQDVAQGSAIGYGSRFIAQRATKIAIIAAGYADGYPRQAPDGVPVLVDGVRAGIAGRVSMDMMTVDVSHITSVKVGTPVELWGAKLAVDEVATACGTIGYELTCAIAPRVARFIKSDYLT